MPMLSRRDFLARIALSSGALALPSLFASACNDDALVDPTESASLDLSTDAGVLNYFYAISQLQTDFWTRVTLNRFPGITPAENSAFASLQSHATSQRNWLQVYQTVGRLTDVLTFSFGDSVNFASRSATMGAALTIEDSATQAYAGGVSYLTDPANIVLAGKLASLNARHSATLRDLNDIIAGGNTRTSFAGDDIIGTNGLEMATRPADVIAALSKFYKTTITVRSA
jgi:ferritin-like protein